MIVKGNRKYIWVDFKDEQELEHIVFENRELLFSSKALLLSKQRIHTFARSATVPDAIIIDFEKDQWGIVEIELDKHGFYKHILSQVSKQIDSAEREETKAKILTSAIKYLGEKCNKELLDALGESHLEVHGRIQSILNKHAFIAIPIDAVNPDMDRWAKEQKGQGREVKVWLIQKFKSGEQVMYAFPDDLLPNFQSPVLEGELDSQPGRGNRGKIGLLLDAKLLKKGQRLHFDYGPRGKKRKRYDATLQANGIKFQGDIYSPSGAAIACLIKAGSNRRTENGLRVWKTDKGECLQDLLDKAR